MTMWHLPEDGLGKNPYGQLLMASLRNRGIRVVPVPYDHLFARRAWTDPPDVIHFQFIAPYVLPAGPSRSWWRAVAKGMLFFVQMVVLRVAGCRIIWTAHNLVNHERRLAGFEWFFNLLFTRLAHAVIVHGEVAKHAFIRLYRARGLADRIVVVPHPNYVGAYPDDVTRESARRQLGIEGEPVVILCLGQIRRYKGLIDIVRAFHTLAGRAPAELWIAGEAVDGALAAELEREAKGSPDIHLHLRYLTADDVGVLLKAGDVVALPYRHILTSGAAVLAMSYGKPCVAPHLDCLVEVLDERGAFFYDPAQSTGLAEALARAIDASAALPVMGQFNLARASEWSWSKAADTLIGVYQGLPGSGVQRTVHSGGE